MVTFRIDSEITLREFETNDAANVFEAVKRNHEHLRVFMSWITESYSIIDARQFIKSQIADREKRSSLVFGIFRQNTVIGSIGFASFDWKAMKTEIGYWISQDEQGKGIVSGACRRLIEFAFEELNLNRIEIRCSAENLRSRAIPRRFGFKLEGLLRQSEFRNGKLHDFEIYGLLASEWAERKYL